jgi:hypothetical protein
MGLLTKAAGKTVPELDEMGKALLDRIRRLPPRKTTPYTALSLLKAYGSFQTGLCLSLRKKNYTSYATIGLGVEKISIPGEKLYSPEIVQGMAEGGGSFIKLPEIAGLDEKSASEGLCYWAFPLDKESPWGALVLLGDNNSPLFNPVPLSQIIGGALEIFSPQIDKILVRKTRSNASQGLAHASDPLEAAIAQYNKLNSEFNGIVLDLPAGAGEGKAEEFNKAVCNMASLVGLTLALPSGRSLVLFPDPLDKELIAHRLSNSLNAEALLVFKAASPGEALELMGPYL